MNISTELKYNILSFINDNPGYLYGRVSQHIKNVLQVPFNDSHLVFLKKKKLIAWESQTDPIYLTKKGKRAIPKLKVNLCIKEYGNHIIIILTLITIVLMIYFNFNKIANNADKQQKQATSTTEHKMLSDTLKIKP